jgi:hypothetical protein
MAWVRWILMIRSSNLGGQALAMRSGMPLELRATTSRPANFVSGVPRQLNALSPRERNCAHRDRRAF